MTILCVDSELDDVADVVFAGIESSLALVLAIPAIAPKGTSEVLVRDMITTTAREIVDGAVSLTLAVGTATERQVDPEMLAFAAALRQRVEELSFEHINQLAGVLNALADQEGKE